MSERWKAWAVIALLVGGGYILSGKQIGTTPATPAKPSGSERATLLAVKPYMTSHGNLHAQVTLRNNADEEMAHIQVDCECSTENGPYASGGGSAPNVPPGATVKTDALCAEKPNGRRPMMECRIGDILPARILNGL